MNKSKIPEFLIWVIYTLASGGCLLLVGASVSMGMGYDFVPGVIGAVVVAVLIGLLVRGIHELAQKKSLRWFFLEKRLLCVVAEGLLFVAMLVGMIGLRTVMPWEVTGNPVYEAARMTGDELQFAQAHGGHKVYLYLMHIMLMLLGNRTFAAVLLQLILLCGAAVALYFGVRKIAGAGAALTATAFLGFAPYMLAETCSLTSFLLFVLCFGLALDCIGGVSESMTATKRITDQVIAILCYLASGALIGFCCYLDMSGIVLLVILTGIICFGDDLRFRDIYGEYPNRFSELLGTPVVVFAGVVIVAFVTFCKTHGSFASVSAQLALYVPGNFRVPITLEQGGTYWEGVLIAAMLLFGVFSFWCSRKMGSRVVWLFAAVLLAVMLCFGINAPTYFNGSAVLYILCVVLAGCGFKDVLALRPEKIQESEETPMAIIDMDAPVEPAENKENNDNNDNNENKANATEPAINFIENPLPLPKKHTRKVMDYDYEVADDDDFDIP